MAAMSLTTFLDKAFKVHGDKYDLTNCNFTAKSNKITVTCSVHGEFYPRAADFLNGSGCRRCADLTRNTLRTTPFSVFLSQAKLLHNNRYSYNEKSYKGIMAKVEIICAKHGSFYQTAVSHLKSSREQCLKCLGHDWSPEDFLERFKEKHGDKYDYTNTVFGKATDSINIRCPTHGEFKQLAYRHREGAGCRACATKNNEVTEAEFLKEAREIHGYRYDYSKMLYVKAKEKVELVCKEHGSFWQTPSSHMHSGAGCPKCPTTYSKPHEAVVNYLKELGFREDVDFLINDRTLLSPKELDIYFPKRRFAIEINGIFWHSLSSSSDVLCNKDKHLKKLLNCSREGVNLIQILDIDIKKDFEKIKAFIDRKLGVNIRNVYARKGEIHLVNSKEARAFLQENHLQGAINSEICLGLFFENQLIHLMTFGKSRFSKKHNYELLRLCTKKGYSVVGGSEKLFKHFISNYLQVDDKIISYCDRARFTGGVYRSLGFTHLRDSKPNYYYVDKPHDKLLGRQSFQKHKLSKVLSNFDPKLTEMSNMFSNGYKVYFDCGNSVWEYTKA